MKKCLIFIILISGYCFAQQQNITYSVSPEAFGENDEITITVSNLDVSAWGVSDAYLWAWSLDADGENSQDSPTNGSWTNSNENQKLTANGDGTYSFTLTPSSFFNRTNIGQIGILIKAKNGDGDKKAQDYIFNVGTFQFNLNSPAKTTTVLNSGESISVVATSSISATFVLKANNIIVDTQTAITDYSYSYAVTENSNFSLEVTKDTETKSALFNAVVSPTVEEAPVPAGMLDGINLDPVDATKATLVLYAPLKDFVHVIGDFNNWQIDNNYLMKKDSASDRFWVELTGLTPQTNHMYQYLVNFEINVADPYSTLVLDPYSDQFIDEVTYPNLPAYPTNLTTEAVTVLRTGDTDYNWETTNFVAPDKTDLVVYEVLLRDFDALHSFEALENRLDYIQKLGVNAIELMPVSEFDGNESWGYNPSFHMALDKYYGTKDAFKSLIDECHSRGIAVILDVVYNHASGQNPYFRLWNDSNGGLGGKATADNPFFNQEAKHSYSVFNDYNHQSTATQDYVKRTAQYWINEYNLDGFRWDLTKGFTQNCAESDDACTNAYQQDRVDVLKQYADDQWAVNDDFYIIFEHLGGITEEEQWADYRVAEGKGILLWNKQTEAYNEALMGYNTAGKSNFSEVSYAQKGFKQASAVSFMESHDEERLLYKSLNFGNEEGNYSTKNLNTSLERLQTAGAFFFTVPGPKMIWQFGELGYDISIDENGRVGNKPILWEYADNPNRKAVYNSWSKIINLKKNAEVFSTSNFTIDASNTNGLKKIHLTLESATVDQIKHIVVLGNFGMSAQSIIADFQETGTWYNLLSKNTPLEVTATTTGINLEAGEFIIYADKPFVDPNDLDSDGVVNANDACPNTPVGTTVTVTGCSLFTLPATNYQIATVSETCKDANNGKINITTAENLNYTATVSGPNSFSVQENFTAELVLEDLSAGTYTVCFTIEGETDYEQCFTLVITEPEDLSVSSKIDRSSKSVSLSLKGAEVYFVTLNGITYETSDKHIDLQLQPGMNRISAQTGIDCQGKFTEEVFVSEEVRFFPNPVVTNLTVYCAGKDTSVTVSLFDFTGRQLLTDTKSIDANREIAIQTTSLKTGKYVVVVKGKTINKTFKIIK
ncbi:putative secreted protein (Por secretion system target) [Cellulophaga sp. RHA19]|uniref:alpha-amylase family glycosyl hydrolase n=1 Tax=Cellulophaga sp. RHA19 TaxID=1798237 RepID=UPI000C2C49FA|nr:alpha-amylase family glycosyl hydrolase [Cellulophaga sp. RHA19]PKB44848.1 putative secreted protein (Por secretion system target) [Cellulophaga sp. RHA19]